jgi:hypothetical protein
MPNPVGNPNWLAGNSGNPKGRPPGVFHTLSDKRSHFLTTLSRAEILAIAKDEKRLDEYTAFEAQVLLGLAETLMDIPEDKLNPSAAREKLYDREIGKAAQPVDVKHSGSVAFFTADVSPLIKFFEEETIRGSETDLPPLVSK